MAPMKDEVLYQMKTSTEYDANLFAADLLIEDQDVEQLSKDEDMSYFGLCSSLYVTPELMSFKLFSLIKRGHAYNMPLELDSKFLAKSPPMQN
jgi:Zn-dependent peptidase ImmA (M78 family)